MAKVSRAASQWAYLAVLVDYEHPYVIQASLLFNFSKFLCLNEGGESRGRKRLRSVRGVIFVLFLLLLLLFIFLFLFCLVLFLLLFDVH